MIKRKRPLTDKEFNFIYSRVPRLCVDIIIKDKKGILLINRSVPPEPGKWHLPGGTVHKGELLEQSVKRISHEELGLKIKIEKFLGVIEYNFKNYLSFPIGLAYLVTTKDKMIDLEKGASEAKYFKVLPNNTQKTQKDFLIKNKLCR